MKTSFAFMVVSVLLAMFMAGCAVPGAPTPTPSPTTQPPGPAVATGTIEIYVTDAPTDNISSIWVTFSEVAVHSANQTANEDENQEEEGGWINITFSDNQTFDLLELGASNLEALLAADNVTAGKYTQLRVIIGEVKVTVGSDNITAVLPSGKLKFVRPFEVFSDNTTTIILDFDAKKSVVVTGSGKYIVKPVVKLSIQQGGKPHQLASVDGTISAVDTEARTVSIIPTGETEAIVLNVNPQTEITLDDEEAILDDLDGLEEGNSVTASYYLNNLKATQIDAESPPE